MTFFYRKEKEEKQKKLNRQTQTLMGSLEHRRERKDNSKNVPRGIFEDRRDDGGGVFFETPPLCLKEGAKETKRTPLRQSVNPNRSLNHAVEAEIVGSMTFL